MRTEWRITTVQWDRDGCCFPQLFGVASQPPKDVPDEHAVPSQVPFQTYTNLDDGKAGWRAAQAGLWVKAWATRAHVSALMVYQNEGRGWQHVDNVHGTESVWLRELPNRRTDPEWHRRVEQMFTTDGSVAA